MESNWAAYLVCVRLQVTQIWCTKLCFVGTLVTLKVSVGRESNKNYFEKVEPVRLSYHRQGLMSNILPLICVDFHMAEDISFVTELLMANIAFKFRKNVMDIQVSLKTFEYLSTNLTHFSDSFLISVRFRTFGWFNIVAILQTCLLSFFDDIRFFLLCTIFLPRSRFKLLFMELLTQFVLRHFDFHFYVTLYIRFCFFGRFVRSCVGRIIILVK